MLFHLFDPMYFVFVAPALLLMLFAQFWVKRAYAVGMQIPARLSGAAAARYILDEAGCQDVAIEEVPGTLSDHYDPRSTCAQAFQRHLSLPHRDGGRHRRARVGPAHAACAQLDAADHPECGRARGDVRRQPPSRCCSSGA